MESGNVEKGIKGVFLLLGLDWFDMVYGMVFDYMYGLFFGVIKINFLFMFSFLNLSKFYFCSKKY